MCRWSTHAMPVVGVCLLSSIVPGCAVCWTPPEVGPAQADTTAMGIDTDLALMSMWPGESRHIALPAIRANANSPRRFEIRSRAYVTFRFGERGGPFSPTIQGALFPLPADSPTSLSVVTMVAGVPGGCTIHVDSLATPGDTLSFTYVVSTGTQPPRFSRWRTRVVVEMPPLLVDGFATPKDRADIGPNPFNPAATVNFVLSNPGRVTFEVFDVRGNHVATVVDSHQGAGAHSATWNGCDERGNAVGSGVYFGRLTSSLGVKTYKLTLVK